MRQGNHSNAKWALAVATLVVLVCGGIVMGSNMGFKLNKPLIVSGLLGPPQGDNVVALPFLVPYGDKQCMCDQLGLPPNTKTSQVETFTGGEEPYFCGVAACGDPAVGGALFIALDPTRGVFITDAAVPGSVIIVGAHQPSLVVNLECLANNPATPGGAKSGPAGDNWVSVPLHTTSNTTQDLCDEMGFGAGDAVMFPFETLTGAFPFSQCGGVSNALVKGESVLVQINTASALCPTGLGDIVPWTPSHF
jgi:hypothetical protein